MVGDLYSLLRLMRKKLQRYWSGMLRTLPPVVTNLIVRSSLSDLSPNSSANPLVTREMVLHESKTALTFLVCPVLTLPMRQMMDMGL